MATEEEVRIIIKAAADQAIGELGKLNSSLGTSQKQTAGVTSKIAGMRTAYYAVIGVLTTVAAVTAKVIKATAEQEAVEAQLVAVLKSTQGAAGLAKDELLDMAGAMQQASIYSDETIVKSQSLLLTFTKIGRDVFPQAEQAILDVSTAMGQDLQQTTIQIGKALQDPILGMTALRRVGIQLSEAQQQQVKDFMAVNDVASAQKVILGELSTQFGGQALARAKTLSGQMQILANNFGDLFEQGDFGNFAKGVVAALNRIILALPMVISQVRIWINQFDAYMEELALSAVLTGKKIADALGMKDASKVATASLAQIMQDHKATMADMAVAQKNFDDAKKKSMMYEAVMSTDTSNIKIQNTKNESAAKTAAKQTEAEEFTTYDMWLEEQKNELSKASLARFTATQKAHYEINKAFLALESKEYQTYSNFMMNSLNKNNKAEFIAFKAFSIIEATMNTYRAASGAFAFGNKIAGPALGAVLAATAVAMGLRHVQAIAKMQPPKAAAGGYIPGSPGGTHLIAGEGGRGEAILPLENPDAMDKIKGAFSGVTINLSGNIFARDDWPREIVMKIDRELYKLKQDRRSALFS